MHKKDIEKSPARSVSGVKNQKNLLIKFQIKTNRFFVIHGEIFLFLIETRLSSSTQPILCVCVECMSKHRERELVLSLYLAITKLNENISTRHIFYYTSYDRAIAAAAWPKILQPKSRNCINLFPVSRLEKLAIRKEKKTTSLHGYRSE